MADFPENALPRRHRSDLPVIARLCRLHGKLVSKSRLFESMAYTPTLLTTHFAIQRQERQGVLVGHVSRKRTTMCLAGSGLTSWD